MPLTIDNLMESKAFTDFLFDNLDSAVLILGDDFRIRKVNDPFQGVVHREEREVIGELCGNAIGCAFAVEEGTLCGTTSKCEICTLRGCVLQGIDQPAESHTSYVSRNFYIGSKSVQKHFKITTKKLVYMGESMNIVVAHDITELENQKNEIRDLAIKDYLTGLYNRMYLFEEGPKLLEAVRRGNAHFSVAMIDIDHFKRVNDSYGHAAGDFVLKTVADTIRSHTRKADLAARYGGEEFCVLLGTSLACDAYDVLETVRKAVESKRYLYEGKEIKATVSCGICGTS